MAISGIVEVSDCEKSSKLRCVECEGTGSSKPDCWMCKGDRSVSLKKAYRHGYKKVDLPEVYDDDGYCGCPVCDWDAHSCIFCGGDGEVDAFVAEQQRNRVLVFGLQSSWRARIPPTFEVDDIGMLAIFRDASEYMSAEAVSVLRTEGLVQWLRSMLGDEVYLTPAGKAAARVAWKEYRVLCRRWVADERARRTVRSFLPILGFMAQALSLKK